MTEPKLSSSCAEPQWNSSRMTSHVALWSRSCRPRRRPDGFSPLSSKLPSLRSRPSTPGDARAEHKELSELPPLLHPILGEPPTTVSSFSPHRDTAPCHFSREQCIRPTLLMTHERLLYADHMRYVWSRAIRGPNVECVWRVDQVFTAGCTSIRIAATLRYE
jgi:hypothetical protein